MLIRHKLNNEQYAELYNLVNEANAPVGSDLEHYKRAVVGILEDNKFKKNGTISIPLGIPNNKELVRWVTNFTGIEKKFIHSFHTVEYKEGSYLDGHFDYKVNKTFVFLLKEAEQGGDFINGNNILKIDKGEVLDYDGSKICHGVTKIIKGSRKVFVAWYSNKVRGALI